MKISDSTAISMPARNLISIVVAVSVGVWAFFGIQERLNRLETAEEIMKNDDTVVGILTGRQKEPLLPIDYHNDSTNKFAKPPRS